MSTSTSRTETTPQTAAPAGSGARRGPSKRWAVPAVCAVLVCGAVAFASFAIIRHEQSPTGQYSSALIRPAGIPSTVSTRLAATMGLSPVPAKTAPNFTLTDQHGSTLSLSKFRGHPVVLTFFDPHCITMCPIVAQEFVDAVHYLARTHLGVVFVAVNVNRHALNVATVAAFTNEHELDTVATWHFFTGSLTSLHRIWAEYGVEVETRIVHGKWTVVHSSTVYFISPSGKELFVASPGADYGNTATHRAYLPTATLAAWGRGISLVARTVAR